MKIYKTKKTPFTVSKKTNKRMKINKIDKMMFEQKEGNNCICEHIQGYCLELDGKPIAFGEDISPKVYEDKSIIERLIKTGLSIGRINNTIEFICVEDTNVNEYTEYTEIQLII